MARYRFRGMLSSVDVSTWVHSDPRLSRLMGLIELRLPPGEGGTRRQRAQALVERLLVAALDDFGTNYSDGLARHINEIIRIRTEIATHYDAVRGMSPNATSLPPNVTPENLSRLFDELELHLDAIESRTPTRHLNDSPRETLVDDVARVSDEIQSGMTPGRAREADAPRREVEPDLPLDDPDFARLELEYSHLPDHQRRWVARRVLAMERRRPGIRERERISRLAHEERSRVIPDDAELRERLEIQAALFAHFHMPGGWSARLRRLPGFGEANLAQLERLRGLDQLFLDNGFELRIRGPGFDFMPDGVRFLDGERTRYQFLEHKEPLTVRDRSYYDTPEGRRDLEATLERHAEIAAGLRSNGCVGFQWSTGQRWLDDAIADAIGRIRERNPNGRFLTVAGRE